MRRFDARRQVGGDLVGHVGIRATLLLHVTERPGRVLVSRLFFSRVSMPTPAVQSNDETNLHC